MTLKLKFPETVRRSRIVQSTITITAFDRETVDMERIVNALKDQMRPMIAEMIQEAYERNTNRTPDGR